MTETSQCIDFDKDINDLAEKAIEAFNLAYKKTAHSNLHDPLIRWCDFILRYIPNAKRKIYKSDRFPVNISDEARIGLQRIEDLFINGGNVNPYQSKTLTLNNDTSDKNKKNEQMVYGQTGEFITYIYLIIQPHQKINTQNVLIGFYS
ncbi:hypothetical protein [Providencia rettgeri]|uniref:hypothetical protein n=1 Tax=Providencia rettgeri TaxID=587 RepID=UPI001F46FD41|nr:hypothetical protein [Providencia rettgeri]